MKIIKKGEMTGIRGFFLNEFNPFSAKSINVTQTVICKKKDFLQCLKKFPEDYEKFCYFRD